MEKVIEIYNNIKDRLSNPFVFSFICSWLVYNWRIPVALIWYDKSQFSGCGCHTIFDFISFELAKTNSFLFPLFFAFVYTISIPFIKNGVRIVSAHAQKWGENEEIKALDGGKIGVEKYLKLREEYKEAIKKLEDVDKEEKEYLTEKGKLLNEFNGVREELNQKIIFQMQYIRNDDMSKTEAYDVFNFVLKYDDSFSVLSGKLNENIIELTKQEV